MFKLFVFVGSNSEESITKRIISKIISKLIELDNYSRKMEIDIVQAKDVNIKYCIGCRNCFSQGICPLDKKDDMKEIKKKMIEADCIILASPVYAHHVPGIMKSFIDRIAYWTHLMCLGGKTGIVISTTESSGWGYVEDYLERILLCTGVNVLDKFHFCNTELDDSEEKMCNYIQQCSEKLYNSLKQNNLISNEFNEQYFKFLKNIYSSLSEEIINTSSHNEIRYWVDGGMIYCNTFSDWIHKRKEINYENI